MAEQVEENKRKEISAVYRHRKEIVVEISGCVIGVVVESGAQRCEDLFLGEWLRAFRKKVMASSSRCQQSVPSKLRNAFTQLRNVVSQKNCFLRNHFPGDNLPEKATMAVNQL